MSVDHEQQALRGTGVASLILAKKWIEAGEPGGVSCTARVFASSMKSASSRQPRPS